MIHKGGSTRLMEICPQCRRGVDGSSARLVSDVCGHPKCRICLLQEINGCLKCASYSKTLPSTVVVPKADPPPRKSVIMSTVDIKHDLQGTQQIIRQTTQKDILFPTDVVKRSTGTFFHLKRLISERYLKDGGGKEDKSSATEEEATNFEQLPSHIVYYCAVHQKTLTDKTAIEKHKKCLDSGSKHFVCDICDKTFVLELKFKQHRKMHKTGLRFKCTVCSKCFKDNYALTTHNRIHTGHKAFTCHICHTQLKQLWSLKRHLAAHKGEKKFLCEVEECNYKFYTRAELNRHKASHSNSKPFSCQTCGARFSYHRSLVRHVSFHKEAAPLICRHCGVTFKRKDNLIRHEKNTHQDQELPEVESPAPQCDTSESEATTWQIL